jgi:hypothetical protein
MEDKAKCSKGGGWSRWIHVGNRASVPNVRFEEEIWLTITRTTPYSWGIVGKVHGAVLDSFESCSMVVSFIKHPIFPTSPSAVTEGAWGHACLKLISIVSVLDKKVKMGIDVHVYDDGCVVHDIVMQIPKILFTVA